MAAPRSGERKKSGPGWLRVIFGLAFLAVAGFAVGMVAGVAWQDPGLAFAYLTGESEEVAWSVPGDAPATAVAAPPASADPPVDPQLRRERETAAPAAVAAAPASADPPADPRLRRELETAAPAAVAAVPAGRLAIQVGAFATSRAAEDLAKSLRAKGYAVSVSPGAAEAESRWRVRVGPLATRAEAEATAARLKKLEKLPTWILSEDAG
jgi:cell division septation protein DedD